MNYAGICVFVNEPSIPITELAVAVEERGFDALFVPENTHMPIVRRRAAPYPEARMKSLASLFDPFVTLGACAAVTRRIELGISVCLLTHRDPIATARSVSSLDVLSGGRLILGVAGGFVAEAMENHGATFRDRWAIVRERTLAMQRIWRDDAPEFHGEFVDFAPFESRSKPLQDGGPPIWIGSNHASVPHKVADYADGWIVFRERYAHDPFVELARACAACKRDMNEIAVTLMDAPQDEPGLDAEIAAGFDRFIFILPAADRSIAFARLDELARLVEHARTTSRSEPLAN